MNVRYNSTSPQGTSYWKIGTLSIAILLNIILVFRLIWGTHSLFSYKELRFQYNIVEQELKKYDGIIAALSEEIQLLQNNPEYMEKMIRQHLNFVKDNQILYLFTDKD